MTRLNAYLTQLIESKKLAAAVAKKPFDFKSMYFEKLNENEQAELIKLAILEDQNTRADLFTNLQSLLSDALDKHEEQEESEKGYAYQDWKQWAISTQLI